MHPVYNKISVKEVRSGLYYLNLTIDNLHERSSRNICRLVYSQASQRYTIKLKPIRRGPSSQNGPRQSRYFVVVERVKPKNAENEINLNGSTTIEAPERVAQHLKSLATSLAKHDEPRYIWLRHDGADFFLTKCTPMKWLLSKWSVNSQPTNVRLWMDFGTETSERAIAGGLIDLFTNQTGCDVEFQLKDGNLLRAHVAVVTAASPVLAALIQSGFDETQLIRVQIVDFNLDVFSQFLAYLYTGRAPKLGEADITRSLYEVADIYHVERLKQECIAALINGLVPENTIANLNWSLLHSVPKLFKAAVDLIADSGRGLRYWLGWRELVGLIGTLASSPSIVLSASWVSWLC